MLKLDNRWSHLSVVITTIQPPTESVRKLAEFTSANAASLLIVGDSKGPFRYDQPGAELWTLDKQRSLSYNLAPLLPVKHYARKNLGYLIAIERGASCIYETDDDNAPLDHWKIRDLEAPAVMLEKQEWVNVYRWFTDKLIWPRGLPLDLIHDPQTFPRAEANSFAAPGRYPIQQGLANNSPDVDAVWRLVLDAEFTFENTQSAALPVGSWCPFNSQSTWWWPDVYPLLYLPSYCSFRMTDIWRSFVAQRCLWELGHGLAFHAPEVYQRRNVHSLSQDFKAEVPGYLDNRRIAAELDKLSLAPGQDNVADNMLRCYESLDRLGVIPSDELPLVKAWVSDVQSLSR